MRTIYIVSGCIRSGTSMMMKMLQEGGLELYYTTPKQGNKYNPDGYFETRNNKELRVIPEWLLAVTDKGVKIFARQLQYLPDVIMGEDMSYKILFMERDPLASARSSSNMKGIYPNKTDEEIITEYNELKEEIKALVKGKKNMEILFVQYPEVISSPEKESTKIKDFFKLELNTTKMAEVPDINKKHF